MKDETNAKVPEKLTKQLLHGTEKILIAEDPRAPKGDVIDGPAHYKGYDVLEIINRYELGFELGNAVKYILRAKAKEKFLEDLKKAKFYLDWFIKRCESKELINEVCKREKKPISSTG